MAKSDEFYCRFDDPLSRERAAREDSDEPDEFPIIGVVAAVLTGVLVVVYGARRLLHVRWIK
jgi:hypothetical protein